VQTIPLVGNGTDVTVLPAIVGVSAGINALTVVWLLANETGPMSDGPLSAADIAIASGVVDATITGPVTLAAGTTVDIAAGATVDIGTAPVIDIANANVLLSSTDTVCLVNQYPWPVNMAPGAHSFADADTGIAGTSFVDELLVLIHAPNVDIANLGLQINAFWVADPAGQKAYLYAEGTTSPVLAAPSYYLASQYYQAAFILPLSQAVFVGQHVTLELFNNGAAAINETLTITVYGHLTTASVQPANDLYSRGALSGALGLTTLAQGIATGANYTFPALGGGSANMQIWNAMVYGQAFGTSPLGSIWLQSGSLLLDSLSLASPGSDRISGIIVPNGSVKVVNGTSANVDVALLVSPHA